MPHIIDRRRRRKNTVGSRARVLRGTVLRTSGGLTKSKLRRNQYGRIVSLAASQRAKRAIASPNSAFRPYIEEVKKLGPGLPFVMYTTATQRLYKK
jgi:hypothetical protein